MPSMGVDIIGFPKACASRATIGVPSSIDVITNTFELLSIGYGLLTKPYKSTLLVNLLLFINSAISSFSSPSPTMATLIFLIFFIISINLLGFLSSINLPKKIRSYSLSHIYPLAFFIISFLLTTL